MSNVAGLHGFVLLVIYFHGFKQLYGCNLVAFWAVAASIDKVLLVIRSPVFKRLYGCNLVAFWAVAASIDKVLL